METSEAGSLRVAGVWFLQHRVRLCGRGTLGRSQAHFVACITGTADVVRQTSHPRITHLFTRVRCCTEGVFSHHLSTGTLDNEQVGANSAQISRLLGAELPGTGHLQGGEGLGSG